MNDPAELTIDARLVGARVCNAARPDWGVGTVLAVRTSQTGDQTVHHVRVQFVSGIKTLVVPPCRLTRPADEPVRQKGWLDTLAGDTLDDRLRRLPNDVLQVLGSPRQRLAAVLPWYGFDADPRLLGRWAMKLTGVGDPLSHWNRDELEAAFDVFRRERDAHLRGLAAVLKQNEGVAALREFLADVPGELRGAVAAALMRII